MSEGHGHSQEKLTKFPIQLSNDARYIAPVVDFIRNVIKPDRMEHIDSHWDYHLGEAVEFTKDGVAMIYDWNESWGHELATKAAAERELKLVRETAERIAAHIRQAP